MKTPEYRKFQLGVKGLIRNKKGQILLLLKSKNHCYGHQPYWDLPGGRVEGNATIKNTLKREIKEEINIKEFKNLGLFHAVISNIYLKKENCGLVLFIYHCLLKKSFTIQLNDEHSDYGWFFKAKAVKLLSIKYPQEFISKIKSDL